MKKILTLAILGSTTFAIADQPATQPPKTEIQEQNVKTETSLDEKISNKIREILSEGWLQEGFQDFTVDIIDGQIILKGYVDSKEKKDKIEGFLKKIDGVVSIKSELVVKEEPLNDEEITKLIREELSSGLFSKGYENLSFDVVEGNVVITGPVETLEQKIKVEENLKKIEGVRSIENKLVIKEISSVANEEISKKIRDLLSSGWFTRGYPNVSFNNLDGNIDLKGFVDTAEERESLEAKIKKINGVKSVNNQLTVKTK